MNLLSHEVQSPLWAKLKEHCEDELAKLRERNDGNLGDLDTARLRGRIAQIKEFLLLETPAEPEPDDA